MNALVFLGAGFILLAAQSMLVVREIRAAQLRDGGTERRGEALDAVWAALPGLLILVLLGYSLARVLGG